ncbi:aspartate kinase [Treponema endosymbiont of Eucomonympha sp.]|uniref:aspartate kinase n=1 Tax=Treponema endosymbiont of Eucomonympha sp. TaxID=1580831 RepID=UPI000750F84F|nr:aspartate kinase [Treponema endosymbiont of Eucomonympha sp.]
MIVMKFGGSSLADAERVRRVASIIGANRAKKPLVVLSAMGNTTDSLLEAAEKAVSGAVDVGAVETLHRETARSLGIAPGETDALLGELKTLLTGVSLVRELSKRSRDYLVSFGERLSVRITAAFLSKSGIPARAFDAWDAGFVSDSAFTQAELLDDVWQAVPATFAAYASGKDGAIPVVTGFIAKDRKGTITTLGRGGSDLTATMLGAALRVDEIQTWKDVDGILSADPRIVPEAHPLHEITYEEAAELAYFGSQVLHPRSMLPCRRTGTLVRVKNSYNIDSEGSVIVEARREAAEPVRAITAVKHSRLLDIVSTRMLGSAGFLAHIFNQFLKWGTSIDVIATSEVSVSLTVNTAQDLSGLLEDIRHVSDVQCHDGKSIVTLICDVTQSSAILAKCFAALAAHGINVQMISQGASKVNISLICDDAESDRVVRILHGAFFGTPHE